MKKTLTVIGLMTALVVLTSGYYTNTGKVGYCGSPGEGTCYSCHNTNPMNQMQFNPAISGQQSSCLTYTPGDVYNFQMGIFPPNGSRIGGFAVEFLDLAGNDAGRILLTDSNTELKISYVGNNKRTTIVHKGGYVSSIPGMVLYDFKWQVPDHDIGTITMHLIGVGADGDGTSNNDYCTYWSYNFTYNPPIINSISEVQSVTDAPQYKFYDLQGKQVANSYSELSLLPKAIYIADSSGVRKKIMN